MVACQATTVVVAGAGAGAAVAVAANAHTAYVARVATGTCAVAALGGGSDGGGGETTSASTRSRRPLHGHFSAAGRAALRVTTFAVHLVGLDLAEATVDTNRCFGY